MKPLGWIVTGALAAAIVAGAGAIAYTGFDGVVPIVAMGVNYVRYFNAPKGTIEIETGPAGVQTASVKSEAGDPKRQRRLAELQQDADLGALFAAWIRSPPPTPRT